MTVKSTQLKPHAFEEFYFTKIATLFFTLYLLAIQIGCNCRYYCCDLNNLINSSYCCSCHILMKIFYEYLQLSLINTKEKLKKKNLPFHTKTQLYKTPPFCDKDKSGHTHKSLFFNKCILIRTSSELFFLPLQKRLLACILSDHKYLRYVLPLPPHLLSILSKNKHLLVIKLHQKNM